MNYELFPIAIGIAIANKVYEKVVLQKVNDFWRCFFSCDCHAELVSASHTNASLLLRP